MDLFSKFIIHNGDSIAGLHYNLPEQMRFKQLTEHLTNSASLRHNGLKSPSAKPRQRLNFNFRSKSNTIAFMLDLSPYMLVYNYGSKAFPIKNLQEIIIHLLKKLAERHQQDPEYNYNVSIYLFSCHQKQLEVKMCLLRWFFRTSRSTNGVWTPYVNSSI
jgi:hypothetical protein